MDLVWQIKDGGKGLLITDLSGFNWWLGLVKVEKIKLIEYQLKSLEADQSHSKPIEVNHKVKKCKSSI